MKHAPNRLSNYIRTQDNALEKFKHTDFIHSHNLGISPLHGNFRISGEISCLGCIVITVQKRIAIVGGSSSDPLVQTVAYSYNVSVGGHGNIFRYDNQDEDFTFRNGHLDAHHKHLFDPNTGIEYDYSPIWIGDNGWPHLSEVVEEAQNWYHEHILELYKPYEYAWLGRIETKPPSLEL